MINAQMRTYNYFTIGEPDNYGQPQISIEPVGTITMAINITSQSTQDNVNYKNCQYSGLTRENITDKFVIQYGDKKLKVLFVNPFGRFKQAFLIEL